MSDTAAHVAVTISGTGAAVPDRVVTNDELARTLDGVDAAWIEARTGIRERRFVDEHECTSDLAARAATAALLRAQLQPTDIDLVIVATSTPDWPQPHTAARVHGLIGMRPDAGSFDINAVCSGFVQALHVGHALLCATESWSHVLVIGADTYSRITDPADRRTRILFGDGAGATIVSRAAGLRHSADIVAQYSYTDAAGSEALIVRAGGSRTPLSAAMIASGDQYFSMNGRAVREFGTTQLTSAMSALARDAGIPRFDAIVPHQSNLRMLEAACAAASVSPAALCTTIERYGNTAAASIPITLDAAARDGRINSGDHVCVVGYGGGLSVAGLALRWG